MPLVRKELELSVERPLGSALDPRAGVVKLTARFEVPPGSDGPSAEELERALDHLREEIGRLPNTGAAADRPLDELVQAYRPRQPELLDLLRAEGEITPGEQEILRTYLAQNAGERAAPNGPAATRITPPVASVGPARGGPPRSVEAILAEHRIQSLREAGLVRARRQISFDEYMALKRYFESRAAAPSAPRATVEGD